MTPHEWTMIRQKVSRLLEIISKIENHSAERKKPSPLLVLYTTKDNLSFLRTILQFETHTDEQQEEIKAIYTRSMKQLSSALFVVPSLVEKHNNIYFMLHFAIQFNDIAFTQDLLEHGASLNCRHVYYGPMPGTLHRSDQGILAFTLAYDNKDMLKFLIEKGADINDFEISESHSIHHEFTFTKLLCKQKNIPIIQWFLEKGFDVSKLLDNKGNTALTLALNDPYEDCCSRLRLLIQNGADVNCQVGYDQETPLMLAMSWKEENVCLPFVQLLLDTKKIDLQLKNKDGLTARDLAVKYKHDKIVQLIDNYTSTPGLLRHSVSTEVSIEQADTIQRNTFSAKQ